MRNKSHPMDAANFAFEHPNGAIYGWFSPLGLRRLLLPAKGTRARAIPVLHSSMNDLRVWALHAALDRYFSGQREAFADLALDLDEGTPFQRAVWQAARATAWGEISTYGALATAIGKPGGARAVGQALGANPVPILVPCHRFLAAGGQLGGFSAGLHWKEVLLRIEGVQI